MHFNTDFFAIALVALLQFGTATAVCDFIIKQNGTQITSGNIWAGATANFLVSGKWAVVSATSECKLSLSGLPNNESYTILPTQDEETEGEDIEQADTPEAS
ncbi:hypothetical protein MGG_14793 [Pyricularia oryzae 70-15]|uniref:Uncharacterized protein n=3 Tax=Pyricularia oryzae TaxID=318829 RepID=G4MTG1_PYRO7|nr:uncharacterized protein MGG_14793 [Pyricularia oryzae 70-15]EHA54712.1 hypothetical protein MGG_14793 [Pyricularia oryzae 70-15]ELQ37470.1 hypothetical protein OOU_Y34scaffold00592g18 [Pyricularia oryzae Y34]KAI7918105.1 hypothetical protein M0657_007763 [Pyricularia oryzae]KAI7918544.1 hypothetical protein M9X92_006810 [Pyricularia oryzae]